MSSSLRLHTAPNLLQKIQSLNWGLIILLVLIAGVGAASLYSAAGASLSPWANKHLVRFAVCVGIMLVIALIDIKWWYRLAWPAYAAGIAMLITVEAMGHVGMGAQRWINLGFIQLQPSELMKIAVVMVLARYFHHRGPEQARNILTLIPAAAIIMAPVALVLLQPDLGTSLMIVMAGAGMVFLAGAPYWLFGLATASVLAAIPVIWNFFLHPYQKQRVLTFLNPESDPLGSGYHITQSKIALGSGGIEGKGFLQGSQSHLNFLPEKQTDFIFTLWAEEWGLLGGLFVLALFGAVFIYGFFIANTARIGFARHLAMGLTINFSLYVFINIAMVMGLIPVVGAPLPLISYGGTAMLAAMIGFGLILSCSVHRDAKFNRV